MRSRQLCRSPMISTLAFLLVATSLAAIGIGFRERFLEMLPSTWRIRMAAVRHGVDVDHTLRIAMPDGAKLAASLYTPRGSHERLPTILVRLPYHRLRYPEAYNSGLFFARSGYAVLVVDLRGTGESEGQFMPWADAASDAVASMEWIARQRWSNGKIGTFGCSALGETQLVSQDRAPSSWQAMIASGAGGAVGSLAGRHTYFGIFEGGVFQLASGFGWFVRWGAPRPEASPARAFDHGEVLRELPISTLVESVRPGANAYNAFMSLPLGDPKWNDLGYLADDTRLHVPALLINTWGDQTVQDTLVLSEHWRRQLSADAAQRLKVVISPGLHCGHEQNDARGTFGELSIANADWPYRDLYLKWFDYWLRGATRALDDLPTYSFYVVGADRWLHAESWPPRDATAERWFLGSSGRANSRSGNGVLSSRPLPQASNDTWRYDPADPVPSVGGPLCCTGNAADRPGPADQTRVEERDDVLVYTSGLLDEDKWIAGPITAHLVVSSSCKDTDVVARLVDVWPDGRATSIQEGALRLRYRNGISAPALLEPGKPVRAVVDLRSIAYRIAKGHRLRLDLTSSSFPRLERNLNTGNANATETRIEVAINTLHYDVDGGSWLELLAMPAPR